ncbi:MAG TPA: hypothetical protein VH988_23300 [Thermoanaerobaculia bacterium]|nr:hypothetical protein [Thermoanaerobaculia bacterium]
MRVLRFLLTPGTDVLNGLDRCLTRGFRSLLLVFAGTLAGWWIYVPIHELLHAAGCAVTGGKVSRLEISAVYGGGLLARLFPFVVSGSDYAGRLSGFDTRGSDLIYLITDLAPFVLTFPGVWLLRRTAAARQAVLFGAALPFALAPFLSLTGDAYEIGSIVVTRVPPWSRWQTLRGDDLLLKIEQMGKLPEAPWAGLALAALLGLLWAFVTWWAADATARRLGQPPVRS